MRTEDTRGEALERRNRLLRDERFHEISLPRLTEAELQQWLASVFGGDASRELVAYLQRYSEGNPLLATQLVRMLLDDGRGALRARPLGPARRNATAICRRSSLGSWTAASTAFRRTRDKILNTAAVIGRVFDVDSRWRPARGPKTKSSTRSTSALRTPSSSRGRIRRERTSRSRTACSSTPFIGRSILAASRAFTSASREAMEEHTPDNVAEIAMHFDRRGIPQQGVPACDARPAVRRCSIYAHAEARRFFEIAERAASNPVERAQRAASPWPKSPKPKAATRSPKNFAIARSPASTAAPRPRHPRTAPHARAHARASGPTGEADDRRLPRARSSTARQLGIARRKRRC